MPHSLAKLHYHCIFGTKDRQPIIEANMRDRLYGYIGGILENNHGRLIRAGGTADHIHLLIELSPVASVADTMRLVKANSSKWMNELPHNGGRFTWQTGYAVFTVSLSGIDDVKRYIEIQEEHHQKKTFEEEYVEFIKRHGLTYDPRYLWE